MSGRAPAFTQSLSVAFCDRCQRATFNARKKAKNAGRERYPSEHMVAVRCPHRPGMWHYAPIELAGRDRD